MTYTNNEIKDSIKRVETFIKKMKKRPLTVQVGKRTLTIAQYLNDIKTMKNARASIKNFRDVKGRYPNYVNIAGYQLTKDYYKILWNISNKVDKNLPDTATPAPSGSGNAEYKTFVGYFGAPKDFDDVLRKIENRGYWHYYNNKYTNKQTLLNLKNRKNSPNCTDICQALHKVAQSMGYIVQGVHVKCKSGEGHIFLRLKHPKNTGNSWIYRDPASVASTGNNNGIKGMWCANGTVLAYNPQWYLNDLNK